MRYRFCKDDINVKSNTQGIVLSLILDGHLKEHMYIGYSVAEAKKKFQQDFGVYPDDYTPVGVHPLNNHGGLAIFLESSAASLKSPCIDNLSAQIHEIYTLPSTGSQNVVLDSTSSPQYKGHFSQICSQ